MHNKTSWNEKLFVGKLYDWYQEYLTKEGVENYAINSLLYITMMRERYGRMYEKCISQLKMYANLIRILSKDYLPFPLLPPAKLQEILKEVKKAIQISNPDYDIVIKRLYLYYNMKLVTFDINKERNLIAQFLVFVQPYTKTTADTVPN